jgi:hypothetical protein
MTAPIRWLVILRWMGDSMGDIKFVSWEEVFLKTMNETDPQKLAQLVPEAELAMFKRELELHNSPQQTEELSTMSIAFEALSIVKRMIAKPRVFERPKGNPARFANFVRRAGAA